MRPAKNFTSRATLCGAASKHNIPYLPAFASASRELRTCAPTVWRAEFWSLRVGDCLELGSCAPALTLLDSLPAHLCRWATLLLRLPARTAVCVGSRATAKASS